MTVVKRKNGFFTLVTAIVAFVNIQAISEAEESIEFRRLYVPEDRVGEVVGDRKYATRNRKEFERLVDELSHEEGESPPPVLATLASYDARFDGRALVEGRARLAFRCLSGQNASYSLTKCNLAIGNPVWDERPIRAARLGTSNRREQILFVEKSGALSFSWSALGVEQSNGDIAFALVLPRCASSQIDLRVPVEWSLSSPDASVRKLEAGDLAESRVWKLVVKSTSTVEIRLTRTAAENRRRPVAAIKHQDLTYLFDRSLVQLLAELQFDVNHRPLRHLSFRVATPLRILKVKLGDNELNFATSRATNDEKIVSVEFPQPVTGTGRKLIVDAVMSPILGRAWRLPSIVVEDTSWQEGRTSLQLVAPMSLDRLELDNCIQTAIKPLEPSKKAIELQQLNADASVTVVLGREPEQVSYVGGSEIRLQDDELRATCRLDFFTTTGKLFELPMEVAGHWIVDSVQASLLATSGETSIDQQTTKIPLEWEFQSADNGTQSVAILLGTPLQPGQVVRVVLHAHRPRPQSGTVLSLAEMQVVAPHKVRKEQHLIALYEDAPHRFELRSERVISWFDPATATPQQRALLPADTGGLFFETDDKSRGLGALLIQSASRFDAEIEVQTNVKADGINETIRVVCRPANDIGNVRVALTRASGREIRWSLEGVGEQGITAKLVTTDETMSSEVWEMTLSRPRSGKFTIVGRTISKSKDNNAVSLAWMPDAVSNRGTLLLSSGDGAWFDVEQTGLTPFPSAPVPSGSFTGRRAAYRYRPGNLPEVRITRRTSIAHTVSAWAWSCHLQSRVAEDATIHSACYRIENVGLNTISLKLPNKTELRQVLVGGRKVNVSSSSDFRIKFALPTAIRYPTVTVTFTDHQSLPSIAGECNARLPEISIPVLNSRWTVWVPPDIKCVEGGLESANSTPRALAKRLLGPLLSESHQTPFSFADVKKTWNGILGQREDDSIVQTRRALDTFSTILKDNTTWSQLLRSYDELVQDKHNDSPLPPLVIDRLSLQRLSISASAVLPASESGRFEEVLDRAGLGLLFTGEQIALVSQRFLAMKRNSLLPSESPLAWSSNEGAQLVGMLSLVPTAQWLDSAACTSTPWSSQDHSGYSELFRAGWSAAEFELEPSDEATAQLVRPSRILVLSWSSFFFASGLGWWLTVQKPRGLFFAAIVAGTTAIVVPIDFSTIATAFLPGLLVGLGIGVVSSGKITLVQSRSNAMLTRESATSRISTVSSALLLAALSLYFLIASPGLADDAAERNVRTAQLTKRKIYSVIIPIDEEKLPVGDDILVPPELYDSLLKLTAYRETPSQSWLIRSAEYDLTLNWTGIGTELRATELVVKYHLDVSNKSNEVLLPLSREQLRIIPDRAMLNGKPVQVDWATDGSGLTFDAGDTGSHVLELPFQPETTAVGNVVGTGVPIPRVHSSVLRVHIPDGAKHISIPSTQGVIERYADSRSVKANLGPVDRLVVNWPRGAVDNDDRDRVSVSQISWLNIGHGSVVLHSKFHFSSQASTLNQVTIQTDPRLTLKLQPDAPVKIVNTSILDNGATRVVSFRRIDDPAKDLAFDVTFLVEDTSGIGIVRLPRVDAVADESLNRWLAISTGAGVRLMDLPPDGTEAIPTNSFLDQWGSRKPDQPVPDATLLLKEPNSPVQFRVLPEPLQLQAQETLQVALGRELATVQFQANIAVASGILFNVRLRIPSQMRVADIQLRQQGEIQSINWKRTGSNDITVHFSQPLASRSTLLLIGEMTLPKSRNGTLPGVTLESISAVRRPIEVYRRSSVLPKLQPGNKWRQIASERVGTLDPSLGRLVSIFEPLADGSPSLDSFPKYSIENNDPSPKYQLGIAATRIDGGWWAEVVCRLHDFKGEVDTLRLDIPSGWDTPIELEEGDALRVTAPGSDRSQLLVQPTTPLLDGSVVRLRGRLFDSPKEVPEIQVLDRRAKSIERFVALQVESANERTEWQTTGLGPATWPEHLSKDASLQSGQHLTYLVVRPRYSARNTGPVAGVPQVRLIDVRFNHGESSYSCVASFDIEPAGQQECVFQLPASTRLLYVGVAGQPCISSARKGNQWGVQLAHDQLPQRVEILYTGNWVVDRPDSENPRSLLLPQIVGVPVARTLITLTGYNQVSRWELQGADVAPLSQELLRLESMQELIDSSRGLAEEQDTEDRRRWYLPWAQRIVTSSRNIAGHRFKSRLEDKSLDVKLLDSARDQLEVAQDLNTADLLNEELKSTVARPDLVGAASACGFSNSNTSRISAKGQLSEVELLPVFSGKQPLWQRLITFAIFPLACVACYAVLSRTPLKEWIFQWLFVFGVVIGMFWWLFLTPSLVGWILIAVSVVGAMRSHGTRESVLRRRSRAA